MNGLLKHLLHGWIKLLKSAGSLQLQLKGEFLNPMLGLFR